MRNRKPGISLTCVALGWLAAGCGGVEGEGAEARPVLEERAGTLGAALLAPAEAEALRQQGVPEEVVEAALSQPEVALVVTLRTQPLGQVLPQVRQVYEPELERLRAEARSLQRAALPEPTASMTEADERTYLRYRREVPESTRRQMREVAERLEERMQTMRRELYERLASAVSGEQAEVSDFVRGLGGRVEGATPVTNALAVRLPATALPALLEREELAEVELDRPAELELDVSAQSVSASAFWNAGYDGGPWDFGLCDTGVDKSHSSLSSHPFYGDATTSGSDHGTHVAGIVTSTHSTHKGIAYGTDAIVSKQCSSTSNVMSGFDWMLRTSTQDADVGNISMGFGTATTDDTSFSRYFDALVDGMGFMVAKSAGNGGNGGTSPTITYPGNSYNILVVANMNDKATSSRSDDTISSSSSQGPTPAGRKKPDITAPGTSITSTVFGNGFGAKSGTSMAAPHVAASVLLLMDSGVYKPASAKAILLNTADAWSSSGKVTGSAWNKVYGWGYLDLWEANYNQDDFFEGSIGAYGSGNHRHVYEGVMHTGEKATLVWNRRAAYNGASSPTTYYPHNRLYLYLKDKETGKTIASSTSTIDNVQQVACPSGYSGKVLQVHVYSPQSTLNGGSTQDYSLATEENFARLP